MTPNNQEKKCDCEEDLHGNCYYCHRNMLVSSPSPTESMEWEKRFDKEFNFWKDITVSPRQAGDFKMAEIMTKHYRNTGEELKAFIAKIPKYYRSEFIRTATRKEMVKREKK